MTRAQQVLGANLALLLVVGGQLGLRSCEQRREAERLALQAAWQAREHEKARARLPELERTLARQMEAEDFAAAQDTAARIEEVERSRPGLPEVKARIAAERPHQEALRFAWSEPRPGWLRLALAWHGLRQIPPQSVFHQRARAAASPLEARRRELLAEEAGEEPESAAETEGVIQDWVRTQRADATASFARVSRAGPAPPPTPTPWRRTRSARRRIFRPRPAPSPRPTPPPGVDATRLRIGGWHPPGLLEPDGRPAPGTPLAILQASGVRLVEVGLTRYELPDPQGPEEALRLLGLDQPLELPSPAAAGPR